MLDHLGIPSVATCVESVLVSILKAVLQNCCRKLPCDETWSPVLSR